MSDRNGDRGDDGNPRSVRAQVGIWLGTICGCIMAYFLLFPVVAFWILRVTNSGLSVPRRLHPSLEALLAPIEWLYENLTWYEAYLNWLMDLLMV